ncbi:MAG: class I SAM-dependent methyltransferase [Chloroflexi bacterium]|nr:class I SAM-dependent methyltransferase [Chloroflexota bacterium]
MSEKRSRRKPTQGRSTRGKSQGRNSQRRKTSWDPIAQWYDGWVGKDGSKHHRHLALPAVIDLLDPQPGERILDVGAGQGVLAPSIKEAGADYVGVEISAQLLELGVKHHGKIGTFIEGDARDLPDLAGIEAGGFDGVVFLLSLQDMDPLQPVLDNAAWALREGGRIVLLMTHPAFRVPRQSGWGWDENRKLQYRRVDRYLTPLPVPLKAYEGGVTRSFHRPLNDYINGLAAAGLLTAQMLEIPTYKEARGPKAKAEKRANEEIPLFLGLLAIKIGWVDESDV